MLLLRDIPLAGESLSSFRQRVWALNAYRLFPVFSPELRRSDPDLQRSSDALAKVATRVGTPQAEIEGLTLWAHPLLHGFSEHKQLHPRWIIPLRYGRHPLGTGSMACPECLRQDGDVYFRAVWRLSVMLTCPLHGARLVERCPQCGFPSWPYAAASQATLFTSQLDMDECPRCRLRLRDVVSDEEHCQSLISCSKDVWAMASVSGVEAERSDFLRDRLCGLRGIINLALSARSKMKLRRVGAFEATFVALDKAGAHGSAFDRLDASTRRCVVAAAWPLLEEWPERFLAFADDAGVSTVDFSEHWCELPPWMRSVVATKLGQPGRFVTDADVLRTIELLQSQGGKVNRESVGRLVGSRHSRPVRARLSKRSAATTEELQSLIHGLERFLDSAPGRRVTSKQVRGRDVSAVLISLLSQRPLSDLSRWVKSDVEQAARTATRNGSNDVAFCAVLINALALATAFYEARGKVGHGGPFFLPFRGAALERGAQKALRAAMVGIDSQLLRRIEVFWIEAKKTCPCERM
ncbi:TniQ family protein [Variovorax sp. E3]|uniref:TniQ family protein n=1 Tax=Variovorax sp. E3 TaxID=1914993 RepID=UPI0022B6F1E4|nr:TniQ family protein [Variovorax sp. E3]